MTANIRLGWKWVAVVNTLAYYAIATITAVISFKIHAPGVNLTKLFFFFVTDGWSK